MDLTVESNTIVTGTTTDLLTMDITGWREGSMNPTAFTHCTPS
jgi:hypothetical protein